MSGYKRNVLPRVKQPVGSCSMAQEDQLCDDPEGRDGVGEGGKLKREANMTGGFQEIVINTVYQALNTD